MVDLPSLEDDDRSKCVRCQHHDMAPDSDYCAGCRAWLLEDSDVDPRAELQAELDLELRGPGVPLEDLVAAGELWLWCEDGELLTGPAALEAAGL